ncbi:hypothetical protein [Reyranella sp.]|uniref:hypothetical protein n=1 Tax=Reyranella sp. TaxID=1929291 RepID=UPI003D0D6BAB
MFRSIWAMVAVGVMACAAGGAWAQYSPIPDTRVPGVGGSDVRPGSMGGSPAGSGSGIGSNVGAGATASPVDGDAKPLPETAQMPEPKPLIGLSRDLPPR